MPENIPTDVHKHVTLIPTDRIRILNPRVRNRRTFEEMVESIARIGLKRPITVSPRPDGEYDLVCGQGRLEAYKQLGQAMVPAAELRATARERLVSDVLLEMETEDLFHMPVVENGRVVGVIARDRILKLLVQAGLVPSRT